MKMRLNVSLALVALSCLPACHDGSSPTGPRPNLAGMYVLTATESCGGGYEGLEVQLVQTGDQISFLLGVDTGSVGGTIRSDTIDVTWVKVVDAGILCGSELTGTAMVRGGMIAGSVAGRSNARSCFACDSDTIAFTLIRR